MVPLRASLGLGVPPPVPQRLLKVEFCAVKEDRASSTAVGLKKPVAVAKNGCSVDGIGMLANGSRYGNPCARISPGFWFAGGEADEGVRMDEVLERTVRAKVCSSTRVFIGSVKQFPHHAFPRPERDQHISRKLQLCGNVPLFFH